MTKPITYFGAGSDAGDNSFLSNFYKEDHLTLEHKFQAAKTDDPSWVARILLAPTPKEAKHLGRAAPMRASWDQEKKAVMLVLLRQKFSNEELRNKLLSTGDAELIEGNWWGDTYWGVCKGVGENWLGRLLMQVREEIKAIIRLPLAGRL